MSLLSTYLDPVSDYVGISESVRVLKPAIVKAVYVAADLIAPGTLDVAPVKIAPLWELVRAAAILATIAVLLTTLLRVAYRKATGYRPPGSYIVDVAVYTDFRPEWCVSPEEWSIRAQKWFNQDSEDIIFCRKILARSGIGSRTHFSPGIAMFPPDISMGAARYEAEIVMFGCVDQLLKRNNIKPQDIDVLVTNCSLFNPTPSLAAMIINKYKMRDDILSYNLAGMGCSASPIAVDLATSLLKTHKKKDPLAIVVSMENITQNIYLGREKPMLLANSLFRMGGAAILLSNSGYAVGNRPAPKYRIQHIVRVHNGADTNAYTCVFQDVDKENKLGVRLDKNLMKVAAQTLTKNITRLGPKILPLHIKIDYVIRLLYRKWQQYTDPTFKPALPVVPRFRDAVQHIGIHAGGRAVIDAIQKALSLSDADVKPSRDVLFRFGNTSSSSIWYETVQIEKTRKPKPGDLILLLAFGSGFKVNTLVMEKLKN